MKIHIYHAPAGHGHRKAAETIAKALISKGVASSEILVADALSFTPYHFREPYLAFYFYSVKYAPELWGQAYYHSDRQEIYFWTKWFRQTANRCHGLALTRKVLEDQPHVIISTHFYSAQLLGKLKQEGKIQAHLITVITDVHPHLFWINEGTDLYWCMHEDTREALMKRGVQPASIITEGIPIDPAFKFQNKKEFLLHQFGFDPSRFTILVTSGSFGIGRYEPLLRILENFSSKIQCLVVCANNLGLMEHLNRLKFHYPIKIFGFVDFMADLMEAADVMIAKSGGLTTAESLAKGIPMIVTAPIPGQELYNSEYLKRHHAAFFAEGPLEIKMIIQNLLERPEMLAIKKEAIMKLAKPDSAARMAEYVISKIHRNPYVVH